MNVNVCPSLVRACSRTLTIGAPTSHPATFTFAILADPQLGLLESYVENRPLPHRWDREVSLVNRAVDVLNRLSPKPLFAVVCGDLVNAQPGMTYREPQTNDLLKAFSNLNPSIKLVTLPGNHDVGDHPTAESIANHVQTWGDDYFLFHVNHVVFLALNSQFWWDDSKCKSAYNEFRDWYNVQLECIKHKSPCLPIILQHIPFFLESPDEPDDYFNIPLRIRNELLSQFYEVGVRHVFTGHLHRNCVKTWLPAASMDRNADPLHLITSSSVCVQLGPDQSGIRLVQVSDRNVVKHTYWSLEKLESLLVDGIQPSFSE